MTRRNVIAGASLADRFGYNVISGRPASSRTYAGRGWRKALIADAMAGLDRIASERSAKQVRRG